MNNLLEFSEQQYSCPRCGTKIEGNEPKPSCNECECCFCSETCREDFHSSGELKHDYNKDFDYD